MSGEALWVGILLTIHVALIAESTICHSPAFDEVGHLPAGLMVWTEGRFDLYRVNPPLVKAIAALPALAAAPKTGALQYKPEPGERPEWDVGRQFITANGDLAFRFWIWARWALIPLSVLGGFLCYRWSRELFGPLAGLLSLTLWTFSPNVLGNAALITPDLGATSLGLLSAYTFAHWLKKPSLRSTVAAGLALGLAELTKMSWIILFGLWPLLWMVHRGLTRNGRFAGNGGRRGPSAWQLGAILFLGWGMLNSAYLFQGTFTPLGEFPFQSAHLTGNPVTEESAVVMGNRFADTALARVPVPLPWDYVIGLDVQKLDFELKKWSYLCGEFKFGGWWYYYLVALALKVPLGFWAIGAFALCLSIRARLRDTAGAFRIAAGRTGAEEAPRGSFAPDPAVCRMNVPLADMLVLGFTPIAILVLVSSQTGFSRYLRYVLPAFPFVFIAMSSAARVFAARGLRIAKLLVAGCLLWGVENSLWHHPHSLSYFNELAGGPQHGDRYLADANLSWGQDVFFLSTWIREHPEARPLTVAYVSFFDMSLAGVDFPMTPSFHADWDYSDEASRRAGPQPGWHIVDIHYLRSYRRHYDYFHEFEPVDHVACSMRVFHLSLEEANAARERLGLPLLNAPATGNEGDDDVDAR